MRILLARRACPAAHLLLRRPNPELPGAGLVGGHNPKMPQVLLAHPDPGDTPGVLESRGWNVLLASDSASCMRLARQDRPDIAVVTASLPDGDGAYLVQRLRALLRTAVTPILGLAASEEQAQKLLDAGAQECLSDPTSSDELVAALTRHHGEELSFPTAPSFAIADPERIDALRSTEMLDTLPEDDIDRFTRLASTLLEAPTALVSLVEEDRQFFKSALGLHRSVEQERQTPLSRSFCQWAVAAREPFVVPDARRDPIVRNNPAIEELEIASYCGIPIFVRDQPVGTLCVIDPEPRAWSPGQVAALQDLADILSSYLQLRGGAGSRP